MWLSSGKQIMNPLFSEGDTFLGCASKPSKCYHPDLVPMSFQKKGFPGVGLLTTTPGNNQSPAE